MYKEAIPDGTFLDNYLRYCSPLETPIAYDFWTGAYLLSCCVGRRAIVDRPHAPVYLNLYLILCADAGVTRKSSALRMCQRIYTAVEYDREYATFTGSTTPETVTQRLALQAAGGGNSQASFIVSELVSVLGREHYTMAMPGLLTDLYDAPGEVRITRAATEDRMLRNVFVNFLAASTSSWLLRSINPEVIEGGFTSRCLFVIEERRKRMVAWPDTTTDDPVPGLVSQLHLIRRGVERWRGSKEQCAIQLSENARTRFVRWYESRGTDGYDPFVASFEAREDHHILRLAGLLCCNDGSYIIHDRHIGHAIKIIEHCKSNAAELFGSGKASRRLIAAVDKLRQVLAVAGMDGIDRTSLLFKMRTAMNTKELDYALAIMHDLGMVQMFEIKTGGRTATWWRGTKKLLLRTTGQLLNERLLS